MRLKEEQGMMAIGVALMLIVVLALLGGTLWQYSMVELRRVERTERDLQALFLARAGAEAVMAAWLEEPIATKPKGAMERIYYDLNTKRFATSKPADFLGYVDVVVTKIDEPDSDRDKLTEITATGVVGNASRVIKVLTYPFLLGHELGWYEEKSGIVKPSANADSEQLVIVRSGTGIHFERSSGKITYQAPTIIFETPADLSYNQETGFLEGLLGNWHHELVVSGDTIFFDDVVLRSYKSGSTEYRSTVVLRLPPESPGIPGPAIGGQGKYGQVYFDGGTVAIQKFRKPSLLSGIKKDGKPQEIKVNNVALAGRAFYFRENTDLSEISAGDLIPIAASEKRSHIFKDLEPFVWE